MACKKAAAAATQDTALKKRKQRLATAFVTILDVQLICR